MGREAQKMPILLLFWSLLGHIFNSSPEFLRRWWKTSEKCCRKYVKAYGVFNFCNEGILTTTRWKVLIICLFVLQKVTKLKCDLVNQHSVSWWLCDLVSLSFSEFAIWRVCYMASLSFGVSAIWRFCQMVTLSFGKLVIQWVCQMTN